ncbi:hypothetical protein CBU02nite_30800 [Clostridium butyricum]|jgi:hypothetical protein|uniref:Uncharacterized protein n=2 Tax=Clostridium butyricum TaxID=1492 RepID=A0A512TQL0_CLOBU|nr:hypothetical protein CBU02nite_30800 [Clostridium butyricum]
MVKIIKGKNIIIKISPFVTYIILKKCEGNMKNNICNLYKEVDALFIDDIVIELEEYYFDLFLKYKIKWSDNNGYAF